VAIRCANCSRWLTPEEAGVPCPRCGSMDRKIFAQDKAVADEKAEVAKELAKKHYQAEAGLQKIFRLTGSAEVEVRPVEPIKLLEVNSNTIPSGVLRPCPCQRNSIPFRHRGGIPGGIPEDPDTGAETAEGLADWRGVAQATGRRRSGVMASPEQWAKGYARQAHADFQSWQSIESNDESGRGQERSAARQLRIPLGGRCPSPSLSPGLGIFPSSPPARPFRSDLCEGLAPSNQSRAGRIAIISRRPLKKTRIFVDQIRRARFSQ
jgi:DNA-directed RNA polymerase subunit RPC12/RpoP